MLLHCYAEEILFCWFVDTMRHWMMDYIAPCGGKVGPGETARQAIKREVL